MSKFKIITPVPGYEGNVGAPGGTTPVTRFIEGEAIVDVVDEGSASRLSYFRTAGYQIEPLDDVPVDVAIRSATMTVHDEAVALENENTQLQRAVGVADLRAENARLRALLADRSGELPSAPAEDDDGALLPPADGAPVADWRAYGELALGLSPAEAGAMTKQQLQRREADRAAAAQIDGGGAR